MVVVPALRGLFGLDVDALANTVTVTPHLPAEWDHASVRQLHIGQSVCDVRYERNGERLAVKLTMVSGPAVHLQPGATSAQATRPGASASHSVPSDDSLLLPLPPVEVGIAHGLPLPGARTQQMKVLEQSGDAHSLRLRLEAPAGSVQRLMVRRNAAGLRLRAEGAELAGNAAEDQSGMKTQASENKPKAERETVVVRFPQGDGYQEQAVTLRW